MSVLSDPQTVLATAKTSLVLFDLPASPKDAFYDVSLQLDIDQQTFSLVVNCATPFSLSPDGTTHFQDLKLILSQQWSASGSNILPLTASGTVMAVVFGQEIPLTISLAPPTPNEAATLTFQPQGALPKITWPNWGELDVTTFEVIPFPTTKEAKAIAHPQVLYLFGEQTGDTIYDGATVAIGDGAMANPIHLKIASDSRDVVEQNFGAIALTGNALIASPTPPGSNESPAKKLIAAFQNSSEITISAWIKPFSNQQAGPARIVTLSKDVSNRYFTLGQGGANDQNGDTYTVRLRSAAGDSNGTQQVLENIGSIAETPSQTYVVYTLKKLENADFTHQANFYVDGLSVPETPQEFNANFADSHPWRIEDEAMQLALGNEISGNRSWQGQLYEVAIYDTALSEPFIYRRYYPDLKIAGQLTLTNMPAPLRGPLPASIAFANPLATSASEKTTRLVVDSEAVRSLAKFFDLVNIDLQWIATLNNGTFTWEFESGEIQSQLWKRNNITFTAAADSALASGQFTLVADAADLTLTPFRGAEPLALTALQLVPVQGDQADDWQWQMRSATKMDEIQLPQPQDGRPFDWAVDFKLLLTDPEPPDQAGMPLVLQDDRVVLQGFWWGEPLALAGEEDGEYLTLQGTRSLKLPFRTAIGPVYEPGTAHQILAPTLIDAVMNVDLTVQVSELGYAAIGVGAFAWTDATNTEQAFTLPLFTLNQPPLRPNQVLDAALETLHSQAPAIAYQQLHHPQDYYCRVINGMPLIYLGASDADIPAVQTVQLPALVTAGTTLDPIQVGMFRLAIATDGVSGYTLTITLPAIDADYRTQLLTDYDDFMAQLDQQNGLIPGTMALVKMRLAECLPLPLQDSLYYHYGLRSAALESAALAPKNIDLQAGMRLRVDFQNYQFVHPALSSASSGFVGSGTNYYYLNSYCDRTPNRPQFFVNFEAFLSQLQPLVNAQIGKHGAASSLDTFNAGYQHPYWRLIYPDQIGDSAASLNPETTAQLVGAAKIADLDNDTAASFFFRGRATVIPEIVVFVNGEPTYVSIGTTLRQVMERSVSVAPLPSSSGSLIQATGQPRLSRLLHIGSASQPNYRWVNLTDDPELFDLPLVKGDRIVVQT